MRLLWLADVLRGAGLTVHEYDGWRTRGLDSFGPILGVVCHGTAGSWTSTDAGELRVLVEGSNTAPPPIANLYLSRSGAWWTVASGTCTGVKTGTAGPLRGYSDDAVLQIEAQHASTEPWTDVQYRSYVRGCAALAAFKASGYDVPVSRIVGHYEHQPTEKTDPWFDMNQFRRDVRAVLNGDDMEQTDKLILKTSNPDQTIGDGLSDLFQERHWRVGVSTTPVPGDEAGEWPKQGSPDWILANLPELLKQHAAAPIDPAVLEAAVGKAVDARLAAFEARLDAKLAAVGAELRDAVADLGEGGAKQVRADEATPAS